MGKFPSGKHGYPQSSHMTSDMGGHGKGGGKGQKPHTGLLSTGNKAAHVKGPRPDEEHKGFMKGITKGHNFEQEIKETFKSGGYANIKPKAMEHSNSPIPGGSPLRGLSNAGGGNAGGSGKAEHHPSMGEAYKFPSPATSGKHGYGHSASQHRGPLRLSGHSGAHRIGSRSK